jgi:hypothetical protein
LDTFEAGWNALGTDVQQKWQAFGHKFNSVWKSWAHVAFEQIRIEFGRKTRPPFHSTLLDFATEQVTNLIESNLSHSGSLFGLPDIAGTRDIRGEMSAVFAKMIIRKEIMGFIQRLKEDIEKEGLDALCKYFSEYK